MTLVGDVYKCVRYQIICCLINTKQSKVETNHLFWTFTRGRFFYKDPPTYDCSQPSTDKYIFMYIIWWICFPPVQMGAHPHPAVPVFSGVQFRKLIISIWCCRAMFSRPVLWWVTVNHLRHFPLSGCRPPVLLHQSSRHPGLPAVDLLPLGPLLTSVPSPLLPDTVQCYAVAGEEWGLARTCLPSPVHPGCVHLNGCVHHLICVVSMRCVFWSQKLFGNNIDDHFCQSFVRKLTQKVQFQVESSSWRKKAQLRWSLNIS